MLELLVVGDDTVVNQAKLGGSVANVRVAVERAGNTMSRPSSVSHGSLRDEDLVHVNLWRITVGCGTGVRVGDTLGNVFSEGSNFADLLEEEDRRVGGVTIDTDTCWGGAKARNGQYKREEMVSVCTKGHTRADIPALS